MYKLVKTTNNNIIIRKDGTKKIAVLRGSDGELVTDEHIENRGLCLKLSEKMRSNKYVAGSFTSAVEAARGLLDK